MQITTLAEARALVGRTFERDGKRRTVVAIRRLSIFGELDDFRTHSVYWKRGGDKPASACPYVDSFAKWLSGATEVGE